MDALAALPHPTCDILASEAGGVKLADGGVELVAHGHQVLHVLVDQPIGAQGLADLHAQAMRYASLCVHACARVCVCACVRVPASVCAGVAYIAVFLFSVINGVKSNEICGLNL